MSEVDDVRTLDIVLDNVLKSAKWVCCARDERCVAAKVCEFRIPLVMVQIVHDRMRWKALELDIVQCPMFGR